MQREGFVAILLQEAVPLSVRQGFSVIATAFSATLGGFLVTFYLLPYPAVMLLAFCLLVYRVYISVIGGGAHILRGLFVERRVLSGRQLTAGQFRFLPYLPPWPTKALY
jgi:hypothetical protein